MENILLPWSVERAKGSNKPGLSWRNREGGMAWPKREAGIRADDLSRSLFQPFIIGRFCNSYPILSNEKRDAWSPSTLANFLWVNSLEHHPSWWTSFSHKIKLYTGCAYQLPKYLYWNSSGQSKRDSCQASVTWFVTSSELQRVFLSQERLNAFTTKKKNKQMGRHYHHHFLNRLFYYCFQSWCLVFNIFLSLLLGIWFATILP